MDICKIYFFVLQAVLYRSLFTLVVSSSTVEAQSALPGLNR